MVNSGPSIQTAIFSLIGELTQYAPMLLLPNFATPIFNSLLKAISCIVGDTADDPSTILQMKNNAIWASGLVATAIGSTAMDPYKPHLLHGLVQLVLASSEKGSHLDVNSLQVRLY